MGGRLAAGFGFKLVYLYTAELFPTTIRNTAIGSNSTAGRVGGIIAVSMQEILAGIWPPLVMVLFGTVSVVAAILAFKFPETANDKLPETIHDALQLGQNVKRNKFGVITSV